MHSKPYTQWHLLVYTNPDTDGRDRLARLSRPQFSFCEFARLYTQLSSLNDVNDAFRIPDDSYSPFIPFRWGSVGSDDLQYEVCMRLVAYMHSTVEVKGLSQEDAYKEIKSHVTSQLGALDHLMSSEYYQGIQSEKMVGLNIELNRAYLEQLRQGMVYKLMLLKHRHTAIPGKPLHGTFGTNGKYSNGEVHLVLCEWLLDPDNHPDRHKDVTQAQKSVNTTTEAYLAISKSNILYHRFLNTETREFSRCAMCYALESKKLLRKTKDKRGLELKKVIDWRIDYYRTWFSNNIVQFNEQKCHEKHKCVEVTSAMPPEIQESILRINPTPFSWDRFASKADFFVF